MIAVACAAVTAFLASAQGGETIRISAPCPVSATAPAIVLRRVLPKPVTIEASGYMLAGVLVHGGGGLVIRGGTISAPGGRDSVALPGYGLTVRAGSVGVTVEAVTFTDANKAIMIDQAAAVAVRFSRCTGRMGDCMIASRSDGVIYSHNVIEGLVTRPTRCTVAGVVTLSLSSRACLALGGIWKDSAHPDVVQLRNGVTNFTAAFNRIRTIDQGLTQMATTGDFALSNVRFEFNDIQAGRHGLTLGDCINCRIEGNTLATAVPGWKAQVIPGKALACGNIVPSGGPGREACL